MPSFQSTILALNTASPVRVRCDTLSKNDLLRICHPDIVEIRWKKRDISAFAKFKRVTPNEVSHLTNILSENLNSYFLFLTCCYVYATSKMIWRVFVSTFLLPKPPVSTV